VRRNDKLPSRQSKKNKTNTTGENNTFRNIGLAEANAVQLAENEFAKNHPFTIGAGILASAK
jgi:hypothetical protein